MLPHGIEGFESLEFNSIIVSKVNDLDTVTELRPLFTCILRSSL